MGSQTTRIDFYRINVNAQHARRPGPLGLPGPLLHPRLGLLYHPLPHRDRPAHARREGRQRSPFDLDMTLAKLEAAGWTVRTLVHRRPRLARPGRPRSAPGSRFGACAAGSRSAWPRATASRSPNSPRSSTTLTKDRSPQGTYHDPPSHPFRPLRLNRGRLAHSSPALRLTPHRPRAAPASQPMPAELRPDPRPVPVQPRHRGGAAT